MVKTTEQQNKTVKYQTNDPQTLPKTELQDGSGYGQRSGPSPYKEDSDYKRNPLTSLEFDLLFHMLSNLIRC